MIFRIMQNPLSVQNVWQRQNYSILIHRYFCQIPSHASAKVAISIGRSLQQIWRNIMSYVLHKKELLTANSWLVTSL